MPIAFILVTILCALSTYLCTDYALVLRDTLNAAGEIQVKDAAAKCMRLKSKKAGKSAQSSAVELPKSDADHKKEEKKS